MSRNLEPLAGINPASHRYEQRDGEEGTARNSDVFCVFIINVY